MDDYDREIGAMLPLLDMFYRATLNLVRATGITPTRWLDTGCGTGTFATLARQAFPGVAFTLADPSPTMLQASQAKMADAEDVSFVSGGTGDLTFPDDSFDVVTAIQCHHYLDEAGRDLAARNCHRMLRPGGVYVTFENIRPLTKQGTQVVLRMWQEFQTGAGRTTAQVAQHISRFDTAYHPITIPQHLELLHQVGFDVAEVLWASYMQAGFWAVKR